MTTSGNQSSDGDRTEARSLTDQRDTPDSGGAFARAPHMAVDAKGYVWRVFDRGTDDETWSMVPVNPNNSPIPQPVTWYAPVPITVRAGDGDAWGRVFKSMHLLARLLHDPTFGEGTLIMARNQARITLNRWNEAVDSELDAVERDTPDTRTPSAEGCGHTEHWLIRDQGATTRHGLVGANGVEGAEGVVLLTRWEPCAATTEGTADRDALAPGDGIVHRSSGATRIISHRKGTDDGWWLHDGSGIADRVLRESWISAQDLTRENERLRAEAESLRTWGPQGQTDAEAAYLAMENRYGEASADLAQAGAERDDLRRQVAAVQDACGYPIKVPSNTTVDPQWLAGYERQAEVVRAALDTVSGDGGTARGAMVHGGSTSTEGAEE